MRIFKSIFLFCWVGLLLSACSPDSVVDTDGIGSGVADNTLITIYFNLPGNVTSETRSLLNGAGTRAEGEDYNYQQQGTDPENSVYKVNLILMGAVPQNGGNYTYGRIAAVIKDILAEEVEGGNTPTYRFTTEVSLLAGYYRIFLIGNPDNNASEMTQLDNSSVTFDVFKDIQRSCTTPGQLKEQLYTDNRFLMTSKYASDQSDIIECTPGGKATTTLQMQRAAARIDYIYNETSEDTKQNIYTTDVVPYNRPSDKVSIKLTRAALFNISKSFFYFKHISADETAGNATIDASATAGNFVIDTDWSGKAQNFAPLTADIVENDFPSTIELSALGTDNSITYDDNQGKGTKLFYTSENTVPTDKQLKGTCTGVLLKGEFGIDKNGQDILDGSTDILVHNNIIYPVEEQEALQQLNEALSTEYGKEITITDTGDAILKSYNVQRFTRTNTTEPFVTYYPVFMRHRNNNDNNVAGPMEFSVVRNTIYRFRVKSISGLGPDIDPGDPVEEPAQIDIQVSATDWVGRTIEFGI